MFVTLASLFHARRSRGPWRDSSRTLDAVDDNALLRIEMDTIWAHDARGRLTHVRGNPARPAPLLAAGTAGGAWLIDIGQEVEDDAAAAVEAYVRALPPPPDRRVPLDAIARLSAMLDPAPDAITFDGGVGYLLPDHLALDSGAPVVTSASPAGERTSLVAPPEANWRSDEWGDLLAGRLGPFAIVRDGGTAISICHCARLTEIAAEAGVWTHPEHRGRRHAVAVTAAWASLLQPSIPYKFYSTSEHNTASQRVAARLGAREIGWVWRWDRASS